MGGAYLTLLNTIANMGVILPKTPVFALIDALTSSTCRGPKGAPVRLPPGLHCAKKARDLGLGPAAEACAAAGGACVLERDGFYVVSYALGVMIMRLVPRLTRLPLERWRAGAGGGTAAARGTKGG
jgi:PAT family acetyl-CoA transporter-like MFS transporter 1